MSTCPPGAPGCSPSSASEAPFPRHTAGSERSTPDARRRTQETGAHNRVELARNRAELPATAGSERLYTHAGAPARACTKKLCGWVLDEPETDFESVGADPTASGLRAAAGAAIRLAGGNREATGESAGG